MRCQMGACRWHLITYMSIRWALLSKPRSLPCCRPQHSAIHWRCGAPRFLVLLFLTAQFYGDPRGWSNVNIVTLHVLKKRCRTARLAHRWPIFHCLLYLMLRPLHWKQKKKRKSTLINDISSLVHGRKSGQRRLKTARLLANQGLNFKVVCRMYIYLYVCVNSQSFSSQNLKVGRWSCLRLCRPFFCDSCRIWPHARDIPKAFALFQVPEIYRSAHCAHLVEPLMHAGVRFCPPARAHSQNSFARWRDSNSEPAPSCCRGLYL